jgi:hypothetical protein
VIVRRFSNCIPSSQRTSLGKLSGERLTAFTNLRRIRLGRGPVGGEFFTPDFVVRILVEMLELDESRVYEPAAAQAECFYKPKRLSQSTAATRQYLRYG